MSSVELRTAERLNGFANAKRLCENAENCAETDGNDLPSEEN